MKRRVFLATSGTSFLAGCNDIQEPTESDESQSSVEDQNDTNTEQMGPGADIRIESDEWLEEGREVEYILGNSGEGQSGSVNLVTRWYDDEGHYIGNDQASIPALRSGSSWFIQVKTTAPFEVTEYDAYVEYETHYSYDELETRSIEIDQEQSVITGIVSHNQEDETEIEIQAVTYSSGWITHSGRVIDARVPDEDWRFILPLSQVGSEEDSVGENVDLMFHVR